MALTSAIKKKSVAGNTRRHLVDITVGAAGDYSSGLTITSALCGFPPGATLDVLNPVGADIGVTILFDPVAAKLRMYKTGAGLSGVLAECAGSDLATHVIRFEAISYSNG